MDDEAIMEALCDGEALKHMGLGDDDQEDIECAFADLKGAQARKSANK